MLPVSDVIPSRTMPWVTVLLMTAHLCVYGYEWLLPGEEFGPFLMAHGLVPAYANWTTLIVAMFIHENVVHVVANAIALWLFGRSVEDRLGHLRYLLLYGLSGLAASGAEIWAAPDSGIATVGASGAVAGIIGAYGFLFPKSRVLVLVPIDLVEVPAVAFIASWFVLQILGGLGHLAPVDAGGIALWGPLGGCLTGIVLGRVLRRTERLHADWWSRR